MLSASCAERPQIAYSEGCELTTDCAPPFVCRLGACREACRQPRDCRPGTTCVRDPEHFGVCQLEDETECTLNSDCPTGLVCHFGQCTNECMNDRDCIAGLLCVPDDAGTQLACNDPYEDECSISSDCGDVLVCARDGRCREECREDRDCRDGRICDTSADPRVCVLPNPLDRPPPPVTFAAGGATTCALSADRLQLRCFGRNTSGEVGDGTTSPSAPPGNVLVGIAVADVDMGETHACAIDDALKCWGGGAEGQLGLGAATTMALSPTDVPMLAGALGVATGFAHSCAWTATELRCWGQNDLGQLGDGTLETRFSPGDALAMVSPVVDAAGGGGHTCAVRDDGTLFCWGDNENGQLGDGTTTRHLVPTRALVSDVVAVVAGELHTCALRRDRQVRCWGSNNAGQTGSGTTAAVSGVVAPTGLAPVIRDHGGGRAHLRARGGRSREVLRPRGPRSAGVDAWRGLRYLARRGGPAGASSRDQGGPLPHLRSSRGRLRLLLRSQ